MKYSKNDFFACAILMAFSLCFTPIAWGAVPTTSVGLWLTAKKNMVVQIAPCAGELCGTIVGYIPAHPGDTTPNDWQGKTECGVTMLHLAQDGDDTHWTGDVTVPSKGTTLSLNAEIDNGDLHLRAYRGIPMLGKSQIWTPFTGTVAANCSVVPAH